MLGTEEANYDAIRWSTLPENKKSLNFSGLGFSLGSSGLGFLGGGAQANFTLANNALRCPVGEESLVRMLIDFRQRPIILYDSDPNVRRAFMSATLSAILHAAHLYVRRENLTLPPYADPVPDGGMAAFEAVANQLEKVLGSVGNQEEHNLTLGYIIKAMCMNIRRMEPRPRSRIGLDRIQGYEFADLVTLDPTTRLKISHHTIGVHRKWSFCADRVPILVCSGIGEAIGPALDHKSTDQVFTVPKGSDTLAAPNRSLRWLLERGDEAVARKILQLQYSIDVVGRHTVPDISGESTVAPPDFSQTSRRCSGGATSLFTATSKAIAEQIDAVVFLGSMNRRRSGGLAAKATLGERTASCPLSVPPPRNHVTPSFTGEDLVRFEAFSRRSNQIEPVSRQRATGNLTRDAATPPLGRQYEQQQHPEHQHQPQPPRPSMPTLGQSGPWSAHDDEVLIKARTMNMAWAEIQKNYFPSKTGNSCRKRYERLMQRNILSLASSESPSNANLAKNATLTLT
jgi:hypothetical protein